MNRVLPLVLVVLLGLFLVAAVGFRGDLSSEGAKSPAPGGVDPAGRAYLLERGRRETGAVNLVTSIYLGYRAFDTLGETIVLMLAVAGIAWYLGRRH